MQTSDLATRGLCPIWVNIIEYVTLVGQPFYLQVTLHMEYCTSSLHNYI